MWWSLLPYAAPQPAAPTTQVIVAASIWCGGSFKFTANGRLMGLRFFMSATADVPIVGVVYDKTAGLFVAAKIWIGGIAASNQWRNCWLGHSFRVTIGVQYDVWIMTRTAYYKTAAALGALGVTRGDITFVASMQSSALAPPAAPAYSTASNAVDVLFLPD